MATLITTLGCTSDDDDQAPMANIPPLGEAPTVIYLIRHAEKADQSPDTHLSEAGLLRAENWAALFQDVEFGAFYSTDFNRTRQTIQPTVDSNAGQIVLYDPFDFSLNNVLQDHLGENILIVGHSNTIPALINEFLGEDIYPEIEETQFGNLYKITILDDAVLNEMSVHN